MSVFIQRRKRSRVDGNRVLYYPLSSVQWWSVVSRYHTTDCYQYIPITHENRWMSPLSNFQVNSNPRTNIHPLTHFFIHLNLFFSMLFYYVLPWFHSHNFPPSFFIHQNQPSPLPSIGQAMASHLVSNIVPIFNSHQTFCD